MTDVIRMIDPVTGEIIDEQQLADQLLNQAKEQGVELIGPDGLLNGLLNGLTRRVLETALEADLTEHLGCEKHGSAVGENARNGTRSKSPANGCLLNSASAPSHSTQCDDRLNPPILGRITAETVVDALEMARWRRRPEPGGRRSGRWCGGGSVSVGEMLSW
jgi:hypothetical protein